MDRIIITSGELKKVDDGGRLPPAIAWPVRLALMPLALVLPVLALAAIVLRVAVRNKPARVREAWSAYLCTLLVVSGLLSSAAGVLLYFLPPSPLIMPTGLAALDETEQFPEVPFASATGAAGVSKLKPLVFVVTPVERGWLGAASPATLGAAALLQADDKGYLIVTGRHVVDGENWKEPRKPASTVGIATFSGDRATAYVAGRHKSKDLALLWLPRRSGKATFRQPIARMSEALEGQKVFVIGHPQGLLFSLSDGLISNVRPEGIVQITAPVSPGSSGGPVYDSSGNLTAIVTSTVDKQSQPNAENLNFTLPADLVLNAKDWNLDQRGRAALDRFLRASQ